MKLLAGLGNPGESYTRTRHNIGFRIADSLAAKYNAKLKKKFLTNAQQASASVLGERIIVLKPLSFMNRSGPCVLHFYKKLNLKLEDILIICDDISLPIGKMRLRPGGQAGGHNGLESIIDSLGDQGFPRLRIGIDNNKTISDLSEYVLSEFTPDEERAMRHIVDNAVNACECWITDGIEAAMNKYN
ncbi:MAG: aminoacyl-tRNA hydrolase [Candidatus Omnitrophota bacterium]